MNTVSFQDVTAHIDFSVIIDAPLDIIIGEPTLKKLGPTMDLKVEFVDITVNGQQVCIPFEPDFGLPEGDYENSKDEIFSSDPSESDTDDREECFANDEEISDEESDDELLMALQKELRCPPISFSTDEEETPDCTTIIYKGVQHLTAISAEFIDRMLCNKGVCTWLVCNLQAANSTVNNVFELMNNSSIYYNSPQMSPRHNAIIRNKIGRMLRSGNIKPANSS